MIKCKIKELSNNLPEKIDYFLICASYEERCLSSYNYIDSKSIENTAVFYFKQFQEDVISNATLLKDKFDAKLYELDNSKPTSIADAVIDFFDQDTVEYEEEKSNVVIDISTFTRESLLIVLKYIEIKKNYFNDIIIFYRAANVSHKLSDAVLSIRSVIGYMGDIIPENPMHLIVISGYEYERAKEIIDTLEPDFITIVYGAKGQSINDDIQNQNEIFTNKLVAYYSPENVDKITHSLIDINSLKKKLNEIIVSKIGYNVVIAPLNNKLSTIAAGLAASDNPQAQICYTQMASYNMTNYSRSLDSCFIEKLNFN